MPKNDEIDWWEMMFSNPTENVGWSEIQPECMLPPKTPEEREYFLKREIHWFVDHWIIVRPDGTRLLNGNEEEFEAALKEFVDGYRSDW